MTVKAQPDGYHAVTPYLIVKDAAGAIDFYQKVFGRQRAVSPGRPRRQGRARRAHDRRLGGHARRREFPAWEHSPRRTIGGSPVRMLHLRR